jgi:hypothetical protein
MKNFKSQCGCEIHIIKWSSKTEMASVKSCPLHKSANKLLDALKKMVQWHGASHDEGCPGDDTCDCKCKLLNDYVNEAINEAEGRAVKI